MPDIKLIGNDNIESISAQLNGYFILGRFPALSAGSLNSILIYLDGSTNAKTAIYSDNSGNPESLLAQSNEASCVAGFNEISLVGSANLIKDTYYWLAFVYQSAINTKRGISGTGVYKYKTVTYSTFVFPESAGSGFTSGTRILSIYGIGSSSAGCPRQAMYMRRFV